MRLLTTRYTWLIVLFNLVVATALVGFGPPKLVDRETSATIRLTPGELQQWYEAAQPPTIGANAVLVYDVDAGRTMYSRNADAPLPPASLTKLMTALLVLESDTLDDSVTVTAEDLVGDSSMGLAAGETLSVQELLWGLLVASGNDAAMALARHISGDVDSFVRAMNARAQELGLSATHFDNPHGLDADGHVSSADDLLMLTMRLLDYPLFREIVETDEIVVAGHTLVNTNEMLDTERDVDGVKTGTTTRAGQCLVLSVRNEGHRLIIILLGSDDRYRDARSLREVYQANYEWVEGNSADLSVMNTLYDSEGNQFWLEADGEPIERLRHRWGDPELVGFRYVTATVDGPLESRQAVGEVEWRSGDDLQSQNVFRVR
ncbi:MAG: D-alanyl-D-alanine carboxypeptidase family protein [Caldilineaceae bacterium]